MRRQLLTGLLMTVALTVLTGLIYPAAVWAVSQVAFKDNADGSFVKNASGQVVGSSLIGQSFLDADGNAIPKYFQPRPSAAGAGYDASASGGSNLGPSNPKLLDAVAQRVAAYRELNGLAADAPVPVDAVTVVGVGSRPAHLGRQREAAGGQGGQGAQPERRPGRSAHRQAHRRPRVGLPR